MGFYVNLNPNNPFFLFPSGRTHIIRLCMIFFRETIIRDGISSQTEQIFTGKEVFFFFTFDTVKRVDDDFLSENVRLFSCIALIFFVNWRCLLIKEMKKIPGGSVQMMIIMFYSFQHLLRKE